MRISDWSSDVCSSDLQQTAFDNRAELRRTHVTGVETQRSPRVMFPDLHGLIWRATRRGNLAPHAETLQKRDARRCKCVNTQVVIVAVREHRRRRTSAIEQLHA